MKLYYKYILILILAAAGITLSNQSNLMAYQMGPSGKVQGDILENDLTVENNSEPATWDEDYFEKYYPVVGITLITPAGFNFLFGYNFNHLGLHFSGGFWGDNLYGGQFNLSLHIYQSKNFLLSFSVIGGFSHIGLENGDSDEWTYLGAALNLNFYGFFLELGLSYGEGSYRNPQLIGQIGYVHRFNN